jgi:hypothetical protein
MVPCFLAFFTFLWTCTDVYTFGEIIASSSLYGLDLVCKGFNLVVGGCVMTMFTRECNRLISFHLCHMRSMFVKNTGTYISSLGWRSLWCLQAQPGLLELLECNVQVLLLSFSLNKGMLAKENHSWQWVFCGLQAATIFLTQTVTAVTKAGYTVISCSLGVK